MEKKGAIACVVVLFFLILLLCVGSGWSNYRTYTQCKQGYEQTATPGPPPLTSGGVLFRTVWTSANTFRGEVIIPGYSIASDTGNNLHLSRTSRGVQNTVFLQTEEITNTQAYRTQFYTQMKELRTSLGNTLTSPSKTITVPSLVQTHKTISGSWRNTAHRPLTRGVGWSTPAPAPETSTANFRIPISKGFYAPQIFMNTTFYANSGTFNVGMEPENIQDNFRFNKASPAGKRISTGSVLNNQPHLKPAYETSGAVAVRTVCN